MYRRVLPLLLTAVLLLSGCAAGQKNMPQKTDEKEMTGQPSDMSGEGSMYMDTTENVIYLAGGCFWGMEQLMQSIPGVIDAESGYANGTCEADADYKTVCKGNTGFRETVRVEYDPGQVSLDALLLAYFYVIDMMSSADLRLTFFSCSFTSLPVSVTVPHFDILHAEEEVVTLPFPTPQAVLKHLKQTGVTGRSIRTAHRVPSTSCAIASSIMST